MIFNASMMTTMFLCRVGMCVASVLLTATIVRLAQFIGARFGKKVVRNAR